MPDDVGFSAAGCTHDEQVLGFALLADHHLRMQANAGRLAFPFACRLGSEHCDGPPTLTQRTSSQWCVVLACAVDQQEGEDCRSTAADAGQSEPGIESPLQARGIELVNPSCIRVPWPRAHKAAGQHGQ